MYVKSTQLFDILMIEEGIEKIFPLSFLNGLLSTNLELISNYVILVI